MDFEEWLRFACSNAARDMGTEFAARYGEALRKVGPDRYLECQRKVKRAVSAWPTSDDIRSRRRTMVRHYAACGEALSPIARVIDDDTMLSNVILCMAVPPSMWEERYKWVVDALLWGARWASLAYPRLKVSTEQAAALCMTDAADDVLEDLESPWPAFLIELSPGTLPVLVNHPWSGKQQLEDCRQLLLIKQRGTRWGTWGDGNWSLHLEVGPTNLHAIGRSARELHSDITQGLSSGLSDLEGRGMAMAGRLAINAVMAVIAHSAPHRPPRTKRKNKINRSLPEWQRNVYVLGTPVKVNVAAALREYLTGERDRLYKVRWVVRGHMRNQAHGPGLRDRKRIWVPPFWKGHGPTLLRPHEL